MSFTVLDFICLITQLFVKTMLQRGKKTITEITNRLYFYSLARFCVRGGYDLQLLIGNRS